MQLVIKRNGKKEKFDFNKIRNAIGNAYKSVNEKMPIGEIDNSSTILQIYAMIVL